MKSGRVLNDLQVAIASIKWDNFQTCDEIEFEESNELKAKFRTYRNFIKSLNSKELSVKEKLESNDFDKWYFEMNYHKNGYVIEGAIYLLPILFYSLRIPENRNKDFIIDDICNILSWIPRTSEEFYFQIKSTPFFHFIPNKIGVKMNIQNARSHIVQREIDFLKNQILRGEVCLREKYIDIVVSGNSQTEFARTIFNEIEGELEEQLRNYFKRELL